MSPFEFIQHSQSLPIIDVRSPAEYGHAHIPNAINVPLFSNEERALVGTLYKKSGRDAAVLLGLEIVGSKLADFVRRAKKIAPQKEVLVHCWRGGMRSGSFAWLLKTAGFSVNILEGGYKAYRNLVLDGLAVPHQFIILGGKTGSGKTDILKEIEKRGEQIIDLEALAHHKGSTFGAIGQLPQPSTEQFENLLYQKVRTLDTTKRIWLEDESRNVGSCYIPQSFYNLMRASKVTFIDVPKHTRIERLVREYAFCEPQLLVDATERIKKRLGGQHHKAALDALAIQDYAAVADMMLTYYDKAYLYGLSQRDQSLISTFEVEKDEPESTANLLIGWIENNV